MRPKYEPYEFCIFKVKIHPSLRGNLNMAYMSSILGMQTIWYKIRWPQGSSWRGHNNPFERVFKNCLRHRHLIFIFNSHLRFPFAWNQSDLKNPCVFVLSCVWLFVTPWTVAYQALLIYEILQAQYWDGFLLLSPGNLPNPGIKPTSLVSPALAGEFFTTEPHGKP